MSIPITTLALLMAMGVGAANAQSTDQVQAVEQVLQRNAGQQAGLAADLAHGSINAREAAALEARQARLYRMEAGALDRGAAPSDLATINRAQRQSGVVVIAPPAHGVGQPAAQRMDAQHLRVAALRDAEQQRAIANGWSGQRYSLQQLAQLEASQAQLAGLQVQLHAAGRESLGQALHLSHLQDIQDWAIATVNPSV